MPGWLWVVLGCLAACVVIVVAAILLVTNRWPWDGDDLD
jgi:ABC-type multidrug transport system permease subunit